LRDTPRNALAITALAIVCIVWGTTYLAIRVAVESIPPLALVALRFTTSGVILLGLAAVSRLPRPGKRDLTRAAAYGVLALGVGNSCLSYAERWIPSGLAALIVTVSPFWMVAVEALVPGGRKPSHGAIAGLLVGLVGVVFLLRPADLAQGWRGPIVRGFTVLQIGCLSWAIASILQRRRIGHLNVIWSGGLQQLAAGLAFTLPAWWSGQLAEARWDTPGLVAIAYLVLFGSIVGYTSYVYALKHLPVPVVSLHNYVNPVVAVLLGWKFGSETFERRELVAMAVIFAGVAMVSRFETAALAAERPVLRPAVWEPAEQQSHSPARPKTGWR